MILPLCIKRGLAGRFCFDKCDSFIWRYQVGKYWAKSATFLYTINRDNLEQLFKVTFSNNECGFPLIGGQIFERQIRNSRYPKQKKLERTYPKNAKSFAKIAVPTA